MELSAAEIMKSEQTMESSRESIVNKGEAGTITSGESGSCSKCSVTLSANAGISINMCGTSLWIDAIHNTKIGDYSTLDPGMLAAMMNSPAFNNPDALIFTHCHEDHFSEELAEKALCEWPDAIAILPEKRLSRQILLQEDAETFTAGNLSVLMIRIPHEGEEYADVPNYACVITPADNMSEDTNYAGGGLSILVLGDAELGNPELERRLRKAGFMLKADQCTYTDIEHEGQDPAGHENAAAGDDLKLSGCRKIDVAIVDFPWAAVRRGRNVIENIIGPEHLIIYHLPFEEDDVRGYRSMIRRVISRIKDIPDIRIMDTFLQTEVIENSRCSVRY